MQTTIDSVLWPTVVYSVLGSTAFIGVIGFLFRTPISHFLSRDLARYSADLARELDEGKAELARQAELERFGLQQKMQDFGLFTTTRHSVCGELFRLASATERQFEVVSDRSGLAGGEYHLWTIGIMKDYLSGVNAPAEDIAFLVDNFHNLGDELRRTTIGAAYSRGVTMQFAAARLSMRNYLEGHAVYLSNDAYSKASELLSVVAPFNPPFTLTNRQRDDAVNRCRSLLRELRFMLQRELREGFQAPARVSVTLSE